MTLAIRMFGGFAVTATPPEGGGEESREATLKLPHLMEAVLAYLVLHKRPCTRDVLLEQFWSDCTVDRARRCLNTTLWRLRCALEPDGVLQGAYLISAGHDEIGFNYSSQSWIDVHEFVLGVSPILNQSMAAVDAQAVQRAKRALALYNAEPLDGFFDDWAIREREHLGCLRLDALGQLMTYHQLHNQPEEALGYARQLLELEPLREDVQRTTMRLQLDLGRRTDALRQFELCKRVLHEELGIEPMPETLALYRSISQGSAAPAHTPAHTHVAALPALTYTGGASEPAGSNERQVRDSLEAMLSTLEGLRSQIRSLLSTMT